MDDAVGPRVSARPHTRESGSTPHGSSCSWISKNSTHPDAAREPGCIYRPRSSIDPPATRLSLPYLLGNGRPRCYSSHRERSTLRHLWLHFSRSVDICPRESISHDLCVSACLKPEVYIYGILLMRSKAKATPAIRSPQQTPY